MIRGLAILGLFPTYACATTSEQSVDRVGDKYEIVIETVTEISSETSSSSSNSRNTLIETVIALRDHSVELEFDHPENTSAEDRARTWEFPVRVLKSEGRPLELLNNQQLEERIQLWLERWEIPSEACGEWVFTWTAFKIECDPESVLGMLEPFDLRRADLRDGAFYHEPTALNSIRLRTEYDSSGHPIYIATMNIDSDAMKRIRAEQALVTAKILGDESVTYETALQRQNKHTISGTITTTFKTDIAGRITHRIRYRVVSTIDEDGMTKSEIITQTTTRKLLHSPEK